MNSLESSVKAVKRGLGLTSRSAVVRLARPAYDLLLHALYERTGLERTVAGEPPLYLAPRYRGITEDTEPTVFAALKDRIGPGAIVLDIGANIGWFTMLAARWAGGAGRVYAFEPAPESLAALRRHVELNGLTERVEVIGQAVSELPGEATFYAHAFNGENSLSANHAGRVPPAETRRVTVTTVDEFCAARGVVPTLLKIDIEGFELHALRGARRTLSKHRPSVIVEMHPAKWDDAGESTASAASTLAALNYRVVPLDGQADPLAEHGHVVLEPTAW
jgi:FkbM family methyltransferase